MTNHSIDSQKKTDNFLNTKGSDHLVLVKFDGEFLQCIDDYSNHHISNSPITTSNKKNIHQPHFLIDLKTFTSLDFFLSKTDLLNYQHQDLIVNYHDKFTSSNHRFNLYLFKLFSCSIGKKTTLTIIDSNQQSKLSTNKLLFIIKDVHGDYLSSDHNSDHKNTIFFLEITLKHHNHCQLLSKNTQTTQNLNIIRKSQHIDLCATLPVEHSQKFTGFNQWSWIPKTIFEGDYKKIDCSQNFLSKKFDAPIFVTSMTGGIQLAAKINKLIAKHCSTKNLPMGIGSVRILLENPELIDNFNVKRNFFDLFLISNLGISQLMDSNYLEHITKACDLVEANALSIHCNIIQELIQAQTKKDLYSIGFNGIWDRITNCVKHCKIPIIFKEVGSGIDYHSAKRLIECGVKAIDISGSGGTSWGYIEGLRSKNSNNYKLGSMFRDWGIPSAYNLNKLSVFKEDIELTVTGGIRDGSDCAKSIALGAKMAGIGLPILQSALKEIDDPDCQHNNSRSYVEDYLNYLIEGIKMIQFATQANTIADLSKNQRLVKGLPYQNIED